MTSPSAFICVPVHEGVCIHVCLSPTPRSNFVVQMQSMKDDIAMLRALNQTAADANLKREPQLREAREQLRESLETLEVVRASYESSRDTLSKWLSTCTGKLSGWGAPVGQMHFWLTLWSTEPRLRSGWLPALFL